MNNSKVFVLGANGNFGLSMRKSLAQHHYQTIAISRSQTKDLGLPGESLVQADATAPELWPLSPKKGDVLVYAINPKYSQWEKYAFEYLDRICRLAESKQLTICFPGNVYHLPTHSNHAIDETFEPHPRTLLGEIRLRMEQRLQQASANGAQVIILRAGDFIAQDDETGSSWFSHLISSAKRKTIVRVPESPQTLHTWAYLPDLSENFVHLISKRKQLGSFNCFHYQGLEFNFNQLLQSLDLQLKINVGKGLWSWTLLKALALVDKNMIGVLQMRYLWQQRLALDDSKLRALLEPEQLYRQSSLEDVLSAVLTVET
ncbi:hypothetical protein DBZ36_05470 [Alginatibacterium sediminis]|uniref:NAD-dependent epimerase/dehydratase family protein n=1 Tax=Alginatibacterium sediminis TaxID=2164068 RepID=A0A420EGU2_9ALTE|nr:hypothetical protein [Alginatibacterium sediminis]RKF19909.1 hypothetical protein DBZ36_05470 [Alginatibacterium sediminis]